MISLEEAQARLLALRPPLAIETTSLTDAAGRWAATDIIAKRMQPVRDISAMDGYAIACAGGSGPWRVVGESAAGRPFDKPVNQGEIVRIFTGASLPSGTDSVIVQEDVIQTGDYIGIDPSLSILAHQHVRTAGSDFMAGQPLITAGALLTPARIALAARGGYGTLPVRARPHVAIMSTGDELVLPGVDPDENQLPSSNAEMLAAMLRSLPCDVSDLGIFPDHLDTLTSAIRGVKADIIVTTGGASVGDHDLVRPAFIAAGATIDFWKIAMRPGKPLMAGMRGQTLCLGLPGNPVSAYVTALLFLKPLIAVISGAAHPLPPRKTGILAVAIPATGPRTDHMRASLLGDILSPIGPNDSAAMTALAEADALIIRPANSKAAQPGDKINYIDLA